MEVVTVTRMRAGRSEFRMPAEARNFYIFEGSPPAMRPNQPPI